MRIEGLLYKDYTGAIQAYEKTGSLTTLQQVTGHSSLQVSLTYLRGLEVAELKEEDMPISTIRNIKY
jgi:hypothetical protein